MSELILRVWDQRWWGAWKRVTQNGCILQTIVETWMRTNVLQREEGDRCESTGNGFKSRIVITYIN